MAHCRFHDAHQHRSCITVQRVQQVQGVFKYTSQQLRIWNEVATIFLVAIVMLVVVKENLSFVWGLAGLLLLVILLLSAIRIYKLLRSK